jgi:hypothetical protein
VIATFFHDFASPGRSDAVVSSNPILFRSSLLLVALAGALFSTTMFSGCTGSAESAGGSDDGRADVSNEAWYAPREDDFRQEYERDAANRDRQSWSGYWSYIRAFYEGNIVFSGWTKQVQAVIELVQSGKVRSELRAALNDLGKRIAAEWAKDNSIRAIDTAALRAFGARLVHARDAEDGSGTVARAEIEAVRAEVNSRLGLQ